MEEKEINNNLIDIWYNLQYIEWKKESKQKIVCGKVKKLLKTLFRKSSGIALWKFRFPHPFSTLATLVTYGMITSKNWKIFQTFSPKKIMKFWKNPSLVEESTFWIWWSNQSKNNNSCYWRGWWRVLNIRWERNGWKIWAMIVKKFWSLSFLSILWGKIKISLN